MSTDVRPPPPNGAPASAPKGTPRHLIWGSLLILAGLVAVMMPGVAALATVLVFAWVLVFGGCFELAYTYQTRHEPGLGWKIASGLITLALGAGLLVLPLAGIASLALMVACFLFAGGIARCGLALRLKPLHGWGWVLFDGLLSIVLALLVLIGWPASSPSLIGLLVGFSLIATGIWRVMWRQPAPPAA